MIAAIADAIAAAERAIAARTGAPLRCIAALRVAAEGDAPAHRQVTFLDDRARGLRDAPARALVVAVGDDGAARCDC